MSPLFYESHHASWFCANDRVVSFVVAASREGKLKDEIDRLRAECLRLRNAVKDSKSDLPPLPEPTGYITENGMRQLKQDGSTVFLYPKPYLIRPNEIPMFTAQQMRSYAAEAVAAVLCDEAADEIERLRAERF